MSTSKKSKYYGSISDDIILCRELNFIHMVLYTKISSLTYKKGYCWATNKFFSDLLGRNQKTISSAISKLEEVGAIEVDIVPEEGNKRYIKVTDKF